MNVEPYRREEVRRSRRPGLRLDLTISIIVPRQFITPENSKPTNFRQILEGDVLCSTRTYHSLLSDPSDESWNE